MNTSNGCQGHSDDCFKMCGGDKKKKIPVLSHTVKIIIIIVLFPCQLVSNIFCEDLHFAKCY